MKHCTKFAGIAAAAFLAAGLATSAGAVTIVSDGGSYDVPSGGLEFAGDVKDRTGGSGSYQVTFNSMNPGGGVALVTIGPKQASTFQDLMMSWLGSDGGSVSTPVTPVETTLSTVFTSPDGLSQSLMFSWSDSLAGSGFDFEGEISPIPVPAAGLMLLTAIAGLGAVRSRRKATAKA